MIEYNSKMIFDEVLKASEDYTSNKATKNNYLKIFYLIYKRNILDKDNNGYGFAVINFTEFKTITKRHYKNILIHMVNKQLIYTNLPIRNKRTGKVNRYWPSNYKRLQGRSKTCGFKQNL